MVWQEVCRGLDGLYLVRKDGVWQSRSLTDRTGAVWWGVLWFGSLGHERFRLARFGWAGLHWNGSVWIGKLGIEMVRQSGIGLVV